MGVEDGEQWEKWRTVEGVDVKNGRKVGRVENGG